MPLVFEPILEPPDSPAAPDDTAEMTPSKCLPFFHPTRVAFVDDDPAFLNLLPLRLGPDVPFLRFDSAPELLEDIETGRLQCRLDLDWWDAYPVQRPNRAAEQVVEFDKSLILLRVFNRARFGTVSVVVTDYRMSGMDGLELCRRLQGLPVKRVLLTGHADESLAVKAFNEGLIDLYLSKLHPRLDVELRLAIRRFQFAFLEEATELIGHVLLTADPAIWGDPGFARFFHQMCEDRGAVEYYAVADPKGYLLVDGNGRAELMLLFTEDDLAAQSASAAVSRAPAGVVRQVETRRSGLYFPSDDSECVLSDEQWWQACVPLRPFPGRDDRFYALIDEPAPYLVGPDTVLGLRQYIDYMG